MSMAASGGTAGSPSDPGRALSPASLAGDQPRPSLRPGRIRSLEARRIAPLLAGGVALLVYLRTLTPGVAWGDWGELPTVSHVLGVAHPTGYPTFVLLGWAAQLLPIGSVAVRLNALVAVCAAAAIGVATATSIRLGARPLIALGVGIALALSSTVWSAATAADAHPLHLLLTALLLHRALVWADRRVSRDLVLLGLLTGLSLGNHLLTLFVAPFVLAYAVLVGRREIRSSWRVAVLAGFAFVAGLGVYAYVPLAALGSPPLAYNHPTTVAALVWLVSGQQFRGDFSFLSTAGPGQLASALPNLWALAGARLMVVLPLLAALGFGSVARRRPGYAAVLFAVGFSAIYVWANYRELEHYLLVAWLVMGIAAAVGGEALASGAERILLVRPSGSGPPSRATARGVHRGVSGAALVGLTLLAAGLGAQNWASADRSGDRTGQVFIDAVFEALPANAAILAYWDASTPLWYGHFVEGLRPDVLIVDDTNIVYDGWGTREARISSLVCSRPVFILRALSAELQPTAAQFGIQPFLPVRVAYGGPTADRDAEIYRVVTPPSCR